MMKDNTVPSTKFVDESTRNACSSLKSLSKQLLLLNASYGNREFTESGPAITRALQQVMTSVRWIQDTLTEAALAMNVEMGETEVQPGPSSVVISDKEYIFLNAVFMEYMEKLNSTSSDFSLFSSPGVDVFGLSPCRQDSERTSSAS